MAAQLELNCAVAVDLVVLTVRDGDFLVLTISRGLAPYRGEEALPGGFVLPGESLFQAAQREVAEEAGVANLGVHLEQLASYGDPDRDPRGRVVSIAYLALLPDAPQPLAGSDAATATWQPVAQLLQNPDRLAFDHAQILRDGVERARAKLEYSPIGAAFCPSEFTINELRQVYEAVWDTALDPRNFHRKVTGTPDFLVATGESTTRGGGRPAALFRVGGARTLHPAMLRP